MEYVYLLKTRECRRLGEDIYKIGRTGDIKTRLGGYGRDSLLVSVHCCWDSKKIERNLIERFKREFKRCEYYGFEYFEGEVGKMRRVLVEMVENEKVLENKKVLECMVPYMDIESDDDDEGDELYNFVDKELVKKEDGCVSSLELRRKIEKGNYMIETRGLDVRLERVLGECRGVFRRGSEVLRRVYVGWVFKEGLVDGGCKGNNGSMIERFLEEDDRFVIEDGAVTLWRNFASAFKEKYDYYNLKSTDKSFSDSGLEIKTIYVCKSCMRKHRKGCCDKYSRKHFTTSRIILNLAFTEQIIKIL